MNHFPRSLILLLTIALLLSACSGEIISQATVMAGPPPERINNSDQSAAPPPTLSPQAQTGSGNLTYPVVDTGQSECYDDSGNTGCPTEGGAFYGQDAQYTGQFQPSYQDNGDGTITDVVTGLMWSQTPDLNGDGQINAADKLTQFDARQNADQFNLAGYTDWRLPTIKELYSLIDFNGQTGVIPYINTDYFAFGYGDQSAGERDIDAQFATSTIYVSTVMDGRPAMFGVNFSDGRIKGYPIGNDGRQEKTFYVLYVRGENGYGSNRFTDGGDGTITDLATGLIWMKEDSGTGLDWGAALHYCETLDFANFTDWRLPNAKELQSIVDYSRSPDTTDSAAIDPLFSTTYLPDGVHDSGEGNYPYYWSSTTLLDGRVLGTYAIYTAFGEARGRMDLGSTRQLMDVHGAGAQRSDPKSGNPDLLDDGHAPQGDVISIYNYARCVRGGLEGQEPVITAPVPQNTTGSPPPAALEACSGLAVGDACTINSPNGEISGTCGQVISGDVACLPAGGPPPGSGQP